MTTYKPWSPDQEFVPVRVPDKMQIALLINEAKGDRTMAQLAEVCNVSPSTLSRAVNGKITKPLTVELIKALAENAKDRGEDFFDRLMRANGMRPKELVENSNVIRNVEERHGRIIIAKNIILSELLRRGVMIKAMPTFSGRGRLVKSDYSLRWSSTFAFEIDDGNKKYLWNFLVVPYQFAPNIRAVYPDLQRVQENTSGWFLIDAWEPEKFNNIKNSIIFIDPRYYDCYIDRAFPPALNGDFSIICVNTDKKKVDSEIMMVRKDGKSFDSVFARNPVEDEDKDDQWGQRPEDF